MKEQVNLIQVRLKMLSSVLTGVFMEDCARIDVFSYGKYIDDK